MSPTEPRQSTIWGTLWAFLALVLTTLACLSAGAQTTAGQQWPMGGQSLRNSRDQKAETVIGTSTVGQLAVKWSFRTGSGVEATPAVVNGVLYFPDKGGDFYAVNAATGALIWSHRITDWSGLPADRSRVSPAVADGVVYLGDQGGHYGFYANGQLNGAGAKLLAVDAGTGQLLWKTQVDPFPLSTITSAPVVFQGVVYVAIAGGPEEDISASAPDYPCCSFRGSVVAVSKTTGHIIWKSYDMPSSPSNPGGYSGGSIWGSTPVVEPKNNTIYVGTGNNFWVPSSVQNCIAVAEVMHQPKSACDSVDNFGQDYADSIVAFDLTTGALKWGYKADLYDVYNAGCSLMLDTCPSPTGQDSDFAAGPNLFDITVNGKAVEVVGDGEKKGIYWTVKAGDGSPLWNTRVGPGLGGRQWGTATDGQRVYISYPNLQHKTYTLQPSGISWNGGDWSALEASTGHILWQTPTLGSCTNPKNGTSGGCGTSGPLTVANGVVYTDETNKAKGAKTMYALDAATGSILWSFAAGQSVHAGPAVVGDTVYWGSGYSPTTPAFMYAFSLNGG
jgi:polyvinyl alcohol dehydrogenase (cytochrome)